MILLPSLNRPLQLKRYIINHMLMDGIEPHQLILEKSDAVNYENISIPDHWPQPMVFEGGKGAATHFNAVFRKYPDLTYYGYLSDDVIPRTEFYDSTLAQAGEKYGFAWPDDGEKGEEFACFGFISGDLVRTVGSLNPLELHHFGFDNFWFHLAKQGGVAHYCSDVLVEHMHPRLGKGELDSTYKDQALQHKVKGDPHHARWKTFRKSPQWDFLVQKVKEVSANYGI